MGRCSVANLDVFVVAVVESMTRIALDLDGSLESLSTSMRGLADALDQRADCTLIRFRSASPLHRPDETAFTWRGLYGPGWRRSRGKRVDELLPPVDVIHVAGALTPPTRHTPLLITVDDLRPLRDESPDKQRIRQLRRAVDRGAILVSSSRTASHEVMEILGLTRPDIRVVRPPVGAIDITTGGNDIVVTVTGRWDRFDELAPELVDFARRHGGRLVVLASGSGTRHVRALGIDAIVRSRRETASALASARIAVYLSDGARFPSFAVAALGAQVPTAARATEINREILNGAAALVATDDEAIPMLEELWSNEQYRAILRSAGAARARDFAPENVAAYYAALYHDVERQFS